MSRGRKKLTLRDFTRQMPSKEDEDRFKQAMNAKSDLVAAIVQAVEIDYILEQSVVSRLERRDDDAIELLCKDNGPLATFFSKIVLGYAMGIYDADVMEYFHVVRRIRNAFAHARRDISFAIPQVRDEFTSLKLPKDKNSHFYEIIALIKRLSKAETELQAAEMNYDESGLPGRACYTMLCLKLQTELYRKQTAAAKAASLRFRRSFDESDPSDFPS